MSDNLRTHLGRWIVQDITDTVRNVYGSDQLASDLREMLMDYVGRLRSDQMLIRMAKEIRETQVRHAIADREDLLTRVSTAPNERDETL